MAEQSPEQSQAPHSAPALRSSLRIDVRLASGLQANWSLSDDTLARFLQLQERGLTGRILLDTWLRMSSSDPIAWARIAGRAADGSAVSIEVNCP